MRSWKAESSQKLVLLKLPFVGFRVFGPQLEDLVKQSVENRKLVAPVRPPSRG